MLQKTHIILKGLQLLLGFLSFIYKVITMRKRFMKKLLNMPSNMKEKILHLTTDMRSDFNR